MLGKRLYSELMEDEEVKSKFSKDINRVVSWPGPFRLMPNAITKEVREFHGIEVYS
jgi:hypothetical protein